MRILLTGATGGLGQALRQRIEDGYETIDDVVIETLGRGAVDFNSPLAVTEAVRALGARAPYDAIVHLAGAEVIAPLRATTDGHYRLTMAAADSAFGILRAAAHRGVMNDGGSIVLMSSVAAQRGTPGMAAYSASKAAIEAMTRCAALEFAPRKISVNAVAAGAFESPMHQRVLRRLPDGDVYARKHPLGIGDAGAVADAIVWLIGPGSCWTTGTVLTVDGGFSAG